MAAAMAAMLLAAEVLPNDRGPDPGKVDNAGVDMAKLPICMPNVGVGSEDSANAAATSAAEYCGRPSSAIVTGLTSFSWRARSRTVDSAVETNAPGAAEMPTTVDLPMTGEGAMALPDTSFRALEDNRFSTVGETIEDETGMPLACKMGTALGNVVLEGNVVTSALDLITPALVAPELVVGTRGEEDCGDAV